MCECMKLLIEKGYVSPNLLRPGDYYIYPVVKERVVKKPLLKIKYCPECGEKVDA